MKFIKNWYKAMWNNSKYELNAKMVLYREKILEKYEGVEQK